MKEQRVKRERKKIVFNTKKKIFGRESFFYDAHKKA